MSTLSIIGWVVLALIWTSMYVRNKKLKQDKIDKETAHAWALINLVASITGFILFVVDLATKLV
jgi:glucose uptake protein GlcU